MEKSYKKPYKKKITRKGKKPVPTNKQLATRIKKIEGQDELKHDDAYAAGTLIDLAGVTANPMLIATQTSDITRIGNEVVAKYSHIRFFYQTNAAVPANRFRFIAFIDRQSNGGLVNLFSSVNPTTALLDDVVVTDSTLSPFNENTKERFGILKDKIYVSNQLVAANGMQHYFDYKFNLSNMKVKYGDGNLAVASMVSKQIWFCWISNSAVASATKPSMTFMHRWLYSDP